MTKLGNYVLGQWLNGEGDGQPIFDAVNGDTIAHATTKGIDLAEVLAWHRRNVGAAATQGKVLTTQGVPLPTECRESTDGVLIVSHYDIVPNLAKEMEPK